MNAAYTPLRKQGTAPSLGRRAQLDVCIRLLVVLALLGVLLYPKPKPHKATLKPLEVLPASPDACIEATDTAKVALLFLSHGNLYHEPSWKLWFQSAVGQLPAETAARSVCKLNNTAAAAVSKFCSTPSRKLKYSNPIAQQLLFNVYIHLSADINEDVMGDMWKDYMIEDRVTAEWGTHTLVEATRNLLWAAFRDPSNQRFVLISEADLPIWDPLTFYRELMSETRSKVDAWWHPDMSEQRWTWRMAASPARIDRSSWRKSAQWFGLIRSHAEVALRDEAVFTAFQDYCLSKWDSDYNRRRECYSDEHYLPTLLHLHGLDEETVPTPLGITAVDWSQGNSAHPMEYQPSDVTPSLFTEKLRSTHDCPSTGEQHAALQASSRGTFVSVDAVFGIERETLCKRLTVDDGKLPEKDRLATGCSLLARKFKQGTVDAAVAVFEDCETGLALTSTSVCSRKIEGGRDGGGGRKEGLVELFEEASAPAGPTTP